MSEPTSGPGGSRFPTTRVGAFPSMGKATSRTAKKTALFLFSVAALLASGTAAVRGQSALDGIGGQARNLFARLSNDTATLQNLTVTQTTVTWIRGGSSPRFTRVAFGYSTDNVNYTPLGNGTATGGNWTLTGLNLPAGQNFYIRGRGYYRSGAQNASESITESVRNAFIAGPAPTPTPGATPTPTPMATPPNVFGRLSTRARVETGDRVLIGSFNVTGSGTKKVLVRALGPSLAGISGRLANPTLELRDGNGALISANDNWRDTQQAEIQATGQAPSNDFESAIVATLSPNVYAAIVRGISNTIGVGKVDIIDVDASANSQLRSMSSRAFAGTENNLVVGEFTINGPQSTRVIVRGLGPSLAPSILPANVVLANPVLELRDSNGALLLANDDWQDDASQAAEITAAGLAPTNSLESAIAATLPPGAYTIHLGGLNCGTGVGLAEAYNRGPKPTTTEMPFSRPLQGCGSILPVITSPLDATGVVDQQFVYQFTATDATLLGAANLPSGLTFNTTLAAIIGAPTTAGTFLVELSASNGAGTTNATLTIEVQPRPPSGPVIISGTAATGRPGLPFRFQVTTTGGTSAARISASGLPAGLSINIVSGLISGTTPAEGSFPVTLTVKDGVFTASSILQLTFTSDTAVPVIVSPGSALLTPGEFFSYTIDAPSTADPSLDPTTFTIVGILPAGLSFDPETGTISGTPDPPLQRSARDRPSEPAISGGYLGQIQLFATNGQGTSTVPLLFLMRPPGLANISTRLAVGTGDNVLIGGFIVTGNAPKVVIVRAIGPSTKIPGALQDPTLELHDSANGVVFNDNWRDTQQQFIIDTTIPPPDDRESAIVVALEPGAYTAIVAGKNGETGIALVEAYDLGTGSLDSSANAKLANISTRGKVLAGDDVMIGGFIISGQATRIIARAIGPSLSGSVPDPLQDPTLELRDSSGTLIGIPNDDWRSHQELVIIETGVPPTDNRESAIVATLNPGPSGYTAIVRGKDGATGVALIEVYALQ